MFMRIIILISMLILMESFLYLQYAVDLALDPEWKNTAVKLITAKILAGKQIYLNFISKS